MRGNEERARARRSGEWGEADGLGFPWVRKITGDSRELSIL